MLKQTFIALLTKYTNDQDLITELWAEIERNYSDKKRHYHTLKHLENLLRIFKTNYFYLKFEAQARVNLEKELTFLTH
ncbi:hypothetical protein VB796_10130 [Arcicella sp. LKC2W]|uniref:hypothetical protein n=1 Tax=Arcicella sp. LKC2W TaxID=2984198 RepID=UPI002B1F7AC3|nr:hypothetical protein [Arcicella sp. LKC2W]MEA5459398.1 hypothetical protein [Arcicella sp. LKC2W]